MMASKAMAVLPVPRSPMISSRCPRPMGVRASTILRPVCIGSWTFLRSMIPGALISMRRISSATMAGPPSRGFPKASTTRPSRPLPVGTEAWTLVRRATSPSRMVSASPKRTTPTLSSSRFSTSPNTSAVPSNLMSSPASTVGRPCRRAMPSPTERTIPVSYCSAWGAKPSSCFFSSEAISSGLTVSIITASLTMRTTGPCGPAATGC